MQRFIWATSLVMLIGAAEASAQQPAPSRKQPGLENHVSLSLGQLQPTPDMWFYDQAMRQYNDPRQQVRQKAEFDMAQRQRRLAAQRWFGVSNARPTAETTPIMTNYSQTWVSNTPNPMQWAGQGGAAPLYQATRPRTVVW